jgi:nucleoid DNA-binding protein
MGKDTTEVANHLKQTKRVQIEHLNNFSLQIKISKVGEVLLNGP